MEGHAIVEARLKQIKAQYDSLMSDPIIAKHVQAVKEHVKKTQDRDMNIHEQRNIAQCLRNAVDWTTLKSSKTGGRVLSEATTEDSIAFLGV